MFKKDKYVVIKQAISKDLATFVANYFSMKKQVYDTCRKTRYISPYEVMVGYYEGETEQIPHTYSCYSDIAMETSDVVILKNDLHSVFIAWKLSQAVIRKIKQNLFWAFFYNVVGIPVAAGFLYVFGGPLLSPVMASVAMAFSSVSVVGNALRLKRVKID